MRNLCKLVEEVSYVNNREMKKKIKDYFKEYDSRNKKKPCMCEIHLRFDQKPCLAHGPGCPCYTK